MATIFTDFGVTIGFSALPVTSYTALGQVVKLSPPSIVGSEVETSNHSASPKSFISGGVYEVSSFKLTVEYNKSDANIAKAVSGVMYSWQITFPNLEVWTFQGFVKSFAPSDADSTKPNVLSAEIEIRPSGANVIS